MSEKNNVTVAAEITLVGHGYQIDIFNASRATRDGQGVTVHSICRDFGGDYDIAEMADTVAAELAELMNRIEETHRRRKGVKKCVVCPTCERSVPVNRDGSVRSHKNRATRKTCNSSGKPHEQMERGPDR